MVWRAASRYKTGMSDSPKSPPLAGIVLAGGRSTRMGADKAGLVWNGRSFLAHARRTLQDAGCRCIHVSGLTGEAGNIPDATPGAGPASAMAGLITQIPLSHGGYLFLAVDTPLLRAGDIARLADGAPVRAQAFSGHPLPCFIPAGMHLTAEPGQSVFRLLESARVEWLAPDAGLTKRLLNVNTPDDLSRLRGPG